MKIKELIQNKRFSKNNTSIHGISENSKEMKKNYICHPKIKGKLRVNIL